MCEALGSSPSPTKILKIERKRPPTGKKVNTNGSREGNIHNTTYFQLAETYCVKFNLKDGGYNK